MLGLVCPLLNWLNLAKTQVYISFLEHFHWLLVSRCETSLRRVRTFRSYQWFRLRFYHNLNCVLLLFVFIRLDRKYYLYFYLNCWQNCFYNVLICSLLSGDLLLQTDCKYTIVQINIQYNALVNQVFANPVSVFILLEFSSWLSTPKCFVFAFTI